VRVLIVGADSAVESLAGVLAEEGIDVERPPASVPASEGDLSSLASELLGFESLLGADPPAAVLVADASDRSLAAVVAATKVPVPVGKVTLGDEGDELNARLIASLADATLGQEQSVAVAWVHGLVPD
jgi:hypothetical protein